jgi:hypothetical protein
MSDALSGVTDRAGGLLVRDRVGLGCRMDRGQADGLVQWSGSQACLVFSGRIDNRAEVAASLRKEGLAINDAQDGNLVLHAYC